MEINKMANESGDMKLLGNYRRLIDLTAAEINYKPTNPLIEVVQMNAQHAAAMAAVNDLPTKIAPNKVAINERQTAYEALPELIRSSMNMLRASGASKKIIDDASTFTRKILGTRKSKPQADNLDTSENKAAATHSASQRSYDAQLGNLRSYTQILVAEPLYNPNETNLKTVFLTTVADDLEAKNNAVSTTFVPVSMARGLRDGLLYTNSESVVNAALLSKAYVKAVFGKSSALYQAIAAMEFKRR